MRSLTHYPLRADDIRELVRAAGLVRTAPASVPETAQDPSRGVVIAIGAFDGVHLGHRELIDSCVRAAHQRGLSSVVVTFDPDPSELLFPGEAEPRLLSVSDRVALCRQLGVDDVLVLPFDRELASLAPSAFIGMLVSRLGRLAAVHVGENFRFGARGLGTVETLSALGGEMGFDVRVHPLLEDSGNTVSSTRIRGLVEQGKVADAASLLGRPHFVRGVVEHGRGEGTSFGFPTANVSCDPRVCMPAQGVYGCIVTDGVRAWPAAANMGKPPTFTGERLPWFLEANLIGFEGDLYERSLSVLFVEWLRASRPFSSLDELERVVLGNIDWVRRNIGASSVEVGS